MSSSMSSRFSIIFATRLGPDPEPVHPPQGPRLAILSKTANLDGRPSRERWPV
jgi:hypothetical protein